LANGITLVRGKGGTMQPVPILDDLVAELSAAKHDRKEVWLVVNS